MRNQKYTKEKGDSKKFLYIADSSTIVLHIYSGTVVPQERRLQLVYQPTNFLFYFNKSRHSIHDCQCFCLIANKSLIMRHISDIKLNCNLRNS